MTRIKTFGFDTLQEAFDDLHVRFGREPDDITVGSDAESDEGFNYPEALEFGTEHIEPRPAWRPAMQKAVARTAQHLVSALREKQTLRTLMVLYALDVRDTVQNLMEGRKSGNVYIIEGKRHQSSAPGEAPAILTGRLHDSVEIKD